GGWGRLKRLRGLVRLRFHNVDTTLEICPILDNNPGSADISNQFRILADFQFVSSFHVALNGPQRHHLARLDSGVHGAIRADSQLMFQRFHRALNLSVDEEIFLAVNLTDDFYGLADCGRAAAARVRLESWSCSHGCCLLFRFYGSWGHGGRSRGSIRRLRYFVLPAFIPHKALLMGL